MAYKVNAVKLRELFLDDGPADFQEYLFEQDIDAGREQEVTRVMACKNMHKAFQDSKVQLAVSNVEVKSSWR